MDAQCSRYAAAIRVQKGRQEAIQDLSSMVIELLKTFYQTCGAKPDRVIFYRDGISEGCATEVMQAEVDSIRRACATLDTSYRPTITFIVVQKRHHARFFPIRKEDSDKSENVLPGTVVETGVVHPSGMLICVYMLLDIYYSQNTNLQNSTFTSVLIPVFKELPNQHIITSFMMKTDSQQILYKN